MKKSWLLIALAGMAAVACTVLMSDGMVYLAAILMSIAVVGAIRSARKSVMKLTRWAKANPGKAQLAIGLLQFVLLGLGIMTGYNLKELGYAFSNATAYIFITILVVGFLSVPFLPKRGTIAIPQEVDKHRLAYLGIALSSFILVAFVGNRIGDVYPDVPVTQVIKTIDHAIFGAGRLPAGSLGQRTTGEDDHEYSRWAEAEGPAAKAVLIAVRAPGKEAIDRSDFSVNASPKDLKEAEKAQKKTLRETRKEFRKELRKTASAGMCVLAVFLIIILLGTTCAGVCLMAGAFGSAAGVGEVLAGALIVAVSIWGIIKAAKLCKRSAAPTS